MDFYKEYNSKLLTAENAAKLIKDGDWVDYGLGHSFPVSIDTALGNRTGELSDVKVRGALSLHPVMVVEKDRERRSFTYSSWHFSGYERKYHDQDLCNYIPMVYRNLPDFYRKHIDVDVACLSVSPINKHGYFSFSLSNSAARAISEKSKKIIVEVNPAMSWAASDRDGYIHISEVDAVVESDQTSVPQLLTGAPTETDFTIAKLITQRLKDNSVIQLGIGGMPNTVGQMIAQSDLKDLGMHTEMLCDAYLDMFKAGKLTNKKKTLDRNKGVWSICLGSNELYQWVDQNPGLSSGPVNYVNCPEVMAQHDRLVAINNCVEVDLYGQTCAESSGFRHISGTGGQLDFLTGAFMAKEGQSFICMSSTYFDKSEGVTKSRISPSLPAGGIVSDPRSQAFYLVTEWGIVNLAGRTTWERAELIISLAHPDFREDLIKQAEKMHIWRRTNKR